MLRTLGNPAAAADHGVNAPMPQRPDGILVIGRHCRRTVLAAIVFGASRVLRRRRCGNST
jgi:hypothetical protein